MVSQGRVWFLEGRGLVSQGRVWFLEGRGLVSQGRVWFLEGRGWSRKVGFRVKRSGKLMVLGLRGLARIGF